MAARNLRPALVSLVDAPAVECRLDPSDRWNGFACPYFTREQLPALFTMIDEGGDMKARLDADDVVRVVSPDSGEDEPEAFEPAVVDGVQMWAVGAWGWVWQIVEGTLTSVECPGCEQPIYLRDDGSTECGGRDEGTCAEANYAHDRARGIADPEWLADEHGFAYNCEPPSPDTCEAILTAHREVSDGDAPPAPLPAPRRMSEASEQTRCYVEALKGFSRAGARLLREWERLQDVVPGSEEAPAEYPFGEDFTETCLKISAWAEAVEKQYEGNL